MRRGIDQRDDGDPEPVGQAHQPDRLAIALGLGHAEIVLEARCGVVAFLMPEQHHAPPVDPRQAADDRRIVGESPVPGERNEVIDDSRHIILEMRSLGMASDLRLLPRSQLRVGIAEELVGLGLEPADLRVDVDRAVARRLAQLGNARLQFGDRLFEVQIGEHVSGAGRTKPRQSSTRTGGERVAGVDQLHQPRTVDMRIDLRRRDVGMAEQRLQHAQVRSAREQVRGKGVAQHVRADALGRNPASAAICRTSWNSRTRLRCPFPLGNSHRLASGTCSRQRATAVSARDEIGTIRSLLPLPSRIRNGWPMRTAPRARPTSSLARRPEP